MKSKQLRALSLCAVFILVTADGATADTPKLDDWVAKRCAAYRGEHCRIPFALLFAQAERIARLGSTVRLKGYLSHERGVYALYPDKETAMRGWESDAIAVRETNEPAILDSLNRWKGGFVKLEGAVVLEASSTNEYWLYFNLDKPAQVQGTTALKRPKQEGG